MWKQNYFVLLSLSLLLCFWCVACPQTCGSILTVERSTDTFLVLKCNSTDIDVKYPMYWSRDFNIIAWVYSKETSYFYNMESYTAVSDEFLNIKKSTGISNDGVYTCAFPLDTTCTQTKSVQLFSTNEGLVTVVKNKGETASFQCNATSPVVWFKGEEMLTYNDMVLQNTSGMVAYHNGTLAIHNIDRDSGEYRCKSASGSAMSNRYLLVVTGKNAITGIQADQSDDIAVAQTRDELIFSLDNLLVFDVLLIVKELKVMAAIVPRKKAHVFLEPSRTIGRLEGSRIVIELKQKTEKDGGLYNFIIEKSGRFYRKSINVEIETEKLLAEPWKSISLTCPPMKGQLTYWRKDGRVIAFSNIVLHPGYTVQGSVLTIKNMTSSGVVYECSASHSVRNFEIKMQETTTTQTTPSITTPPPTTPTTTTPPPPTPFKVVLSTENDNLFFIILGCVIGVLVLLFLIIACALRYLLQKYTRRARETHTNARGVDNMSMRL